MIEFLPIEIVIKDSKNVPLIFDCRYPSGDSTLFLFVKYLKNVLSKNHTTNKAIALTDVLDIYTLDFDISKGPKFCLNFDMIPIINKTTCFTLKTTITVDYFFTNVVPNTEFKTRIV